MARLYANLATLPDLREVFTTMHRYPALVSGTGNGDAAVATALNAVAKRGAAGCGGVAVEGRLGIAVKSWDGDGAVVDAVVVATLAQLGALTPYAVEQLASVASPSVLGGRASVGQLEPRFELEWS
jgi:L-asparaginase II